MTWSVIPVGRVGTCTQRLITEKGNRMMVSEVFTSGLRSDRDDHDRDRGRGDNRRWHRVYDWRCRCWRWER